MMEFCCERKRVLLLITGM